MRQAYGVLFRQWEHAFAIAAANRDAGAQPASWRDILDAVQTYRVIKRTGSDDHSNPTIVAAQGCTDTTRDVPSMTALSQLLRKRIWPRRATSSG